MTWIHAFAADQEPDHEQLGTKGAGLAEMTRLGLPVPPGFTLVTGACSHFFATGETWPDGLHAELDAAVAALEARTGRRFADPAAPLLVSVRSGAAVAMPGMMDTVLDIGLNRETARALAEITGSARFAWDTYRRFVQMFGDVVLGIHYTRFSRVQETFLAGRSLDELDAEALEALCGPLEEVVAEYGHAFPSEPAEQLRLAIDAVFRSYNSHRARYWRKTHGIPDDAGTAVNVQKMVFGNRGDDSGTGLAVTRDPKTGAPGLWGDWLCNAQGEEFAGGARPSSPLDDAHGDGSLQGQLPDTYARLVEVASQLEGHFRDVQEIEFTVERGNLWLLQTRAAERSAPAAVQIVVDLVGEGMLSRTEAIGRIDPRALEYVLRPVISPDAKRKVIARGLDASPGAACGRVVFESQDCQELFDRDEPSILVRLETSPEDIQGMTVAMGVLTGRGGQTSHAAVVARGMGKPCVVGCTDIQVDYARELFYAGDSVVQKGDWITIDGGTGEVMEGRVEMLAPQSDTGAMATLLDWADEVARLKVRANADTGSDATRARQLGAVGVGLCRTEHMFFQPEALRAMRRMILADDPRSRQRALNEILPIQRAMFVDLFRAMDGLPVTIRLLDPPLHEFLPAREADITEVANDLGVRPEKLRARLGQLSENNPMLGHRGVRVGITAPEVYRTQVRAIVEAACEVSREGYSVVPEIMIPLVALNTEIEIMRQLVIDTAEAVVAEYGSGPAYRVGTMIEVPRACLVADEIARHADFFSFGTNDLTQLTYAFSRDDVGRFLPAYQRMGLFKTSPLTEFDVAGVGRLVETGVERGRAANPRLSMGVCGEHGGDPIGVGFFHTIGLDYVSCSPYRVPVARLAAAHAALGLL